MQAFLESGEAAQTADQADQGTATETEATTQEGGQAGEKPAAAATNQTEKTKTKAFAKMDATREPDAKGKGKKKKAKLPVGQRPEADPLAESKLLFDKTDLKEKQHKLREIAKEP